MLYYVIEDPIGLMKYGNTFLQIALRNNLREMTSTNGILYFMERD